MTLEEAAEVKGSIPAHLAASLWLAELDLEPQRTSKVDFFAVFQEKVDLVVQILSLAIKVISQLSLQA